MEGMLFPSPGVPTPTHIRMGFLYVMDVEDLKSGCPYQIQVIGEALKESPDMDGLQWWSFLQKSSYRGGGNFARG